MDNKIRCIAVDDEPLALEQLARFIANIPQLELVERCYDVNQAREILAQGNIDLMFLDIEMPDCNGVEFAHSLGDKAPYIIFITAYPEYAVEGFRLDAVDYLLKPLSQEELEYAVSKAERRMTIDRQGREEDNVLYVKTGSAVRRIILDDILYVKGLSEYVQFVMKGERTPVTSLLSMKHLETVLPAGTFMRVHKSYIINLSHMQLADRIHVIINGEYIPVGEKYRTNLMDYLRDKVAK